MVAPNAQFSGQYSRKNQEHDIANKVDKLLRVSMTKHSHQAYNSGLTAFELFRNGHQLESSWPPPVEHIILL